MAINFNHLSSTPSTSSRDKVEQQPAVKSGASTDNGADNASAQSTVQFSNEALALQQLEEQVGKLPDINEGRIAVIKAALEDGTYTIDAERLAGNILAFDDELTSATNR